MNICEAVSIRIKKLLLEKDMTIYRLEKNSGILHGTMMGIINVRNQNVSFKTIMQLARGFNINHLEFLNDEIFFNEELEID